MGATRRRRQSRARSSALPRLRTLTLGSSAVVENASAGTLVGAVLGASSGSTILLLDDAGGRFALSGDQVITGAVGLDRETAASHAIVLRETLAGYANSPRDTELTITVLNAFEAPDLAALALSRTTFATAVPDSGAIFGATAGSAIVADSLPVGLSIDGEARSWAWDGTGAIGSGSLSLTESHADASNSPRTTAIGWTIAEAPSVAISDEFPILKSAYEAGERALIAWIGDSTVAYAVPGGHEAESSVGYLRQYLDAAGLSGVIGGCFGGLGDKGLITTGVQSLSGYASYYDPDVVYAGSFSSYALGSTLFGQSQSYATTAGDRVRYDPGFDYDRVEVIYPPFTSFGGPSDIEIRIGSTLVATLDGAQAPAMRKAGPYAITRTSAPLDQVNLANNSTLGWTASVRVWDSTAPRSLQVENLGVCGATCAYFLATTGGDQPALAAGNTLGIIGCHLAIVQLGVNEQNNGVSAATYQTNLTALIDALAATGSDVLVCLPPPALGGYAMDADHRAAVAAACTAAGIGAPVDLHGGIGFNTATDLADDVHPNASGNFKIVHGTEGVGARILGVG